MIVTANEGKKCKTGTTNFARDTERRLETKKPKQTVKGELSFVGVVFNRIPLNKPFVSCVLINCGCESVELIFKIKIELFVAEKLN